MPLHVFLLPHQDDEAPVFQEIERLVKAGAPLAVAYLTSGHDSGEPDRRRTQESQYVLGNMGVPCEAIHFIGSDLKVPDGDLMSHLDALHQRLSAMIQAGGGLASIHMPAWEGGHQDHDASHILGVALANEHQALAHAYQFPSYHGYKLPGILYRVLNPLPANGPPETTRLSWGQRLRYLRYLTHYRSQTMTWVGLGPFFALHYLLQGTQVRQPVSVERLFERPHEGPMLYERRRFSGYDRFVKLAGAFRDKHLRKS
jgi:LmbE family N-acetylglucosaminyl deacetylase